jgi:hypothetical protein
MWPTQLEMRIKKSRLEYEICLEISSLAPKRSVYTHRGKQGQKISVEKQLNLKL